VRTRASATGQRPRAATRGFTLVEALVAIAILGLVALLAWRATAAMTDSEVRLANESARWRELDTVVARVEADLRASLPRRARSGNATEAALSLAPQDAAGDALLIFTRAGPDAVDEAGSGGQRVGYRLRDGSIEALFWPAIDNPAATVPAAYPLTGGIRRFQVAALGAGDAWSERWPVTGDADLPRGLRVTLELADGLRIERWIALQ